jgi:hypothetical protein
MAVFGWLKSILRRVPALGAASQDVPRQPAEESSSDAVWCVAANVLMERGHGPGGTEKRRGTKHFAPGAKVLVYYFFWGEGGERVTVIGRHRKSRRFIRLTMSSKHLANWRAELVYSPYVAKQVREFGEFAGLTAGSEKARLRAEEIAASYIKQGAPSQPFVTRPPNTGPAGG